MEGSADILMINGLHFLTVTSLPDDDLAVDQLRVIKCMQRLPTFIKT